MSSKIRIDYDPNEIDEEYFEELEESADQRTSRLKYTSKRRRQIEDMMEERRLMKQIGDVYDERL